MHDGQLGGVGQVREANIRYGPRGEDGRGAYVRIRYRVGQHMHKHVLNATQDKTRQGVKTTITGGVAVGESALGIAMRLARGTASLRFGTVDWLYVRSGAHGHEWPAKGPRTAQNGHKGLARLHIFFSVPMACSVACCVLLTVGVASSYYGERGGVPFRCGVTNTTAC